MRDTKPISVTIIVNEIMTYDWNNSRYWRWSADIDGSSVIWNLHVPVQIPDRSTAPRPGAGICMIFDRMLRERVDHEKLPPGRH